MITPFDLPRAARLFFYVTPRVLFSTLPAKVYSVRFAISFWPFGHSLNTH